MSRALYDKARAWAEAKWGRRVHNVNYKRTGLYEVSLDGPPRTGELHLIHWSERDFVEVPRVLDGRATWRASVNEGGGSDGT